MNRIDKYVEFGTRVERLRNTTCIYCGFNLTKQNLTKEHVVGRRFVPRGFLDNHFNLIANACKYCNNKKSDLEDEISSVTLQPASSGRYACDSQEFVAEVARKAGRSLSRRSGKVVADSKERLELVAPFFHGVGTISMRFDAPPQIDQHRLIELTFLHILAFNYWFTYNESTHTGGLLPGMHFFVAHAHRGDWGNPVMRFYMEWVRQWEPLYCIITAREFFKVQMVRERSTNLSAWAIEWNKNYRLIGFMGTWDQLDGFRAACPRLEAQLLFESGQRQIKMRKDVPLKDDDDTLFVHDVLTEPAPHSHSRSRG